MEKKSQEQFQILQNIGNPLDDPYKKDRDISRVDVSFTYNGQSYTVKASSYHNTVRLGDECDVYILDNNPSNYITDFSGIHSSSFAFIILRILAIVGLLGSISSVFMFSVSISTYKKVLKNSRSITGKIVNVEKTGKNYYILCSSDQVNGSDMIFKSHPYTSDVSDLIKKHNFVKFEIKYTPENIKNYFIDTDKLDKIYYM